MTPIGGMEKELSFFNILASCLQDMLKESRGTFPISKVPIDLLLILKDHIHTHTYMCVYNIQNTCLDSTMSYHNCSLSMFVHSSNLIGYEHVIRIVHGFNPCRFINTFLDLSTQSFDMEARSQEDLQIYWNHIE